MTACMSIAPEAQSPVSTPHGRARSSQDREIPTLAPSRFAQVYFDIEIDGAPAGEGAAERA
jgi:hypothetical protein